MRRNRLVTAQSAYHLATTFEGLAVLRAKFKAEQPPEYTPEEIAAQRAELARRIEIVVASHRQERAEQERAEQERAEQERAKAEAERVALPPLKPLPELAAELGIDEEYYAGRRIKARASDRGIEARSRATAPRCRSATDRRAAARWR